MGEGLGVFESSSMMFLMSSSSPPSVLRGELAVEKGRGEE